MAHDSKPPNSAQMPVAYEMQQPKRRAGKPVTVKVQLPLAGADLALIYTEDKSLVMQVSPGEVRKRFYKDEFKAFFKAELMDDGILELGERIRKDPGW